MKKLWIVPVILALALAACSSNTESATEVPEPTPTAASLAPAGSPEETYQAELADIVGTLTESVDDIENRLANDDLTTGASRENFGAAIIAWESMNARLNAMTVPDAYQDVHNEVTSAADQLANAATLIEQGLANEDPASLSEGAEQAAASLSALQTALDEISA